MLLFEMNRVGRTREMIRGGGAGTPKLSARSFDILAPASSRSTVIRWHTTRCGLCRFLVANILLTCPAHIVGCETLIRLAQQTGSGRSANLLVMNWFEQTKAYCVPSGIPGCYGVYAAQGVNGESIRVGGG
jgi:hypothetical protein